MYLYQNTENSQNKHQILNRIVKSIEKQVKYSDVDNYFLKLIKKQDKLFLIAYENNNSSKWDEIKTKTKLFICAKQLAKLQHFIKTHYIIRNSKPKNFMFLLSKIMKANMVETIKPIRNDER